jgi:hypothetical protein
MVTTSRTNEWQAAVERFTGGYGSPPDFNEDEDRAAFLQLLREELSSTEMAEFFTREAARLREEGT